MAASTDTLDGTHAGAKALRQATEASVAGVTLDAYTDESGHEELATALEKWGQRHPDRQEPLGCRTIRRRLQAVT